MVQTEILDLGSGISFSF